MKRRDLIASVAAATAAWPLASRAQKPERMRRVAVLMHLPETDPPARRLVSRFAQALMRLGWSEGTNVNISTRFGTADPALLQRYAAELVALSPDVILAATPPAVAAVRRQTRTIPLVFVLVTDPVGLGFVQSFAKPGDGVTGFTTADPAIMGKWLQLLKEMAPRVTTVAAIFNPDTAPYAPLYNHELEAAAPSLGITLTFAQVHDDTGIEAAIEAAARGPGGGIVALPDAFLVAHRAVIVAAASRHRLPLIGVDIFAPAGGLMSYWNDAAALYTEAASYVDRILRGATPADLPVQQPTKYLLSINLKTAKALGLTLPQTILERADEVIE